jgi:hypothetical protein
MHRTAVTHSSWCCEKRANIDVVSERFFDSIVSATGTSSATKRSIAGDQNRFTVFV